MPIEAKSARSVTNTVLLPRKLAAATGTSDGDGGDTTGRVVTVGNGVVTDVSVRAGGNVARGGAAAGGDTWNRAGGYTAAPRGMPSIAPRVSVSVSRGTDGGAGSRSGGGAAVNGGGGWVIGEGRATSGVPAGACAFGCTGKSADRANGGSVACGRSAPPWLSSQGGRAEGTVGAALGCGCK